jgi:triacylglycerol lipase
MTMMGASRIRVLLFAAWAVAATAGAPPPAAAGDAGPALSVSAAEVRAAMECPAEFSRPAVLLVHGTATNARESWSWNYLKTLPAEGYDVCTVDLPDRSLGDIQLSSEYVVHAVRAMRAASGRRIAVIGHSQGTLQPRWALKWWPDVRAAVGDFVSLAGPHHGASGADGVCFSGSCAPAAHQMRTGSRFLAALNSGDETPRGPSYTSIYSASDELVQPPRTAVLAGARNLLVQDLCPGRPVHHGGLLHDAVVHRLVLDALTHRGPADPQRFQRATCAQGSMPGADDPVAGNAMLYGPALVAVLRYPTVAQEPALAPYARRQ